MTPLAPERYALQVTIGQGTHDKLRRAQELLSHALPSGNVAEVLDRALDSLIHELEKRKFSATSKPRAKARASENPRHIPAHVKRAVMARDEGRCTFVSDCGRRCSSRKFLEFDHVTEVARGGSASISGIRLRCRAHNQYTAERTFGPALMDAKRRAAAGAREAARQQAPFEARESAKKLPAGAAISGTAANADTVGRAGAAANADSMVNAVSVGSTGSAEAAAAHGAKGRTVCATESTSAKTASPDAPELPTLAETFARSRLSAAFSTPNPASPHSRPAIGT